MILLSKSGCSIPRVFWASWVLEYRPASAGDLGAGEDRYRIRIRAELPQVKTAIENNLQSRIFNPGAAHNTATLGDDVGQRQDRHEEERSDVRLGWCWL
jgi:hypothetical protein